MFDIELILWPELFVAVVAVKERKTMSSTQLIISSSWKATLTNTSSRNRKSTHCFMMYEMSEI